MFMQSNGGLAEAGHFRGKDAILSGPAGGIVGMARMSQLAGFDRVIGFDMGGTSTDVSHFAGEYERVFTTQVAGVRLRAPDAGHPHRRRRRRVDPALRRQPLPRRPGLGRRRPRPRLLPRRRPAHRHRRQRDARPHPARALPARVRSRRRPAARRRDRAARGSPSWPPRSASDTGDDRTPEQVAEGYLQIAVANMANAVKRISVQKGHDVTRYALTTFGGAGGQHACAVADSLGIRTVLVPPMAGVLSALGIGLADTTAMREQSVEAPLEAAAHGAVGDGRRRPGVDRPRRAARRGRPERAHPGHAGRTLRYDGTDTALTGRAGRARRHGGRLRGEPPRDVLLPDGPSARRRGRLGGGDRTHRAARSVRTSAISSADAPAPARTPSGSTPADRGATSRCADRERMRPGDDRDRPGDHRRGQRHHRRRRRLAGDGDRRPGICSSSAWSRPPEPDVGHRGRPGLLEIFNNLFMSIAEQMGARLESTAQSVNIKERLDFSCALFDPDGNLVANAPHIPVHLGSMGTTVKEVIRRRAGAMRPGDVVRGQRPVPRRHAPARRHRGHPGLRRRRASDDPVLRRLARPPRRDRRDHPRLHAGQQPRDRRGGRAVRQLAAGRERHGSARRRRRGCSPRRRTRRAIPTTNLADLRAQIAANQKGVEEVGA